MSYFRENIESMEGYVPGEQPRDTNVTKLNTNENPYPPSPKVIAALQEAIDPSLRLYPDPVATVVKERAAAVFGTVPERILVGNGSDDNLTMVIRSFVAEGDLVAFPYPTYTLYETLTQIQGGACRTPDYAEDYSLPEGLADLDAKVTFVANPNSPSGTMVPPAAVSELAERCRGVVVVDEAYGDFATENCLSLVARHENLVVLRSFSKSHSLAGLRIGFAIAQEALIEGMLKVKDSYNIDRLSIAAAAAALDDVAYMQQNVAKIRETRQYLTERLEALGLFVYPSQANFLLARCTRPPARDLHQRLKGKGIFVRYFNRRRTDDCLRITIGTREQIDRLLEELERMIKAG